MPLPLEGVAGRDQRLTVCGVADEGIQRSPVAGESVRDFSSITFGTKGARSGFADVVREADSFDHREVVLVLRYVATVGMVRFQRPFLGSFDGAFHRVPLTVLRGSSTRRFGTVVRTGIAVVVRAAEWDAQRRLALRGRRVGGAGAFQSPFSGVRLGGCQSEPVAGGRMILLVSFFFRTGKR